MPWYDNHKVTMERNRAGLRQGKVAQLIGLRQPQLSLKETGKGPFTTQELNALATLYGVALDAFKRDDPTNYR